VEQKSEERRVRHVVRTEGTPSLLRASGLAQILGVTEQAIRNALYRGEEGKSIPRSFKLGHRRVWLRRDVQRWLNERQRAAWREEK
jgi:predicted DNA-binding transcriptional regulator AlpA